MMEEMLPPIFGDNQIVRIIVARPLIIMVNLFALTEAPPKFLFRDQPVLISVAANVG